MKPRLDIDFCAARWRPPLAGIVLLLVSGILLGSGVWELWRAGESNEIARTDLEAVMRRASPAKHTIAVASTPAAKLAEKQSQAILRELTVPWQDLLSIVENYPEHDVALIGIDQNPAQGQIRIVAEAKDADAMIAYLKYLQSSALLREAVLNAHLVETNVPGTPIRFQVAAVWRKP